MQLLQKISSKNQTASKDVIFDLGDKFLSVTLSSLPFVDF